MIAKIIVPAPDIHLTAKGRHDHLRRASRSRLERHRLEPRPAAVVRTDSQVRNRSRHDRQGTLLQYGIVSRSAPRQSHHLYRDAVAENTAHRRDAGDPAL